MTELLTTAEMRAIEMDAIATGNVSGLALMEKAGRGVVDAILRHWPEARSACILCGPGNNGGDGYVIARLLAERGWALRVHGMGEAEKMPPDARTNRLIWEEAGEVRPLTEESVRFGGPGDHGQGPPPDVYVDAIFGTGLKRAPEGDLLGLLRHMGGAGGDVPDYRRRLVAVDAPSGLDMDTGRMLAGGEASAGRSSVPLCALTVTFEAPKLGHFLAEGPACCGLLEIVDLGLQRWRSTRRDAINGDIRAADAPVTPRARLIDREPMVTPSALAPGHRAPNFTKSSGHKYDHGHVLIVSGGSGHTGAARLAARSALRVGAGLVTVASPPNALHENAMHLTAIMTRRCDGAEGLASLLVDPRYNAVCLGPGLGVGGATRDMVLAALAARRSVVLDADALTSFDDAPDALFAAIKATQDTRDTGKTPDCHVVLTPHAGEFRRLFPDIAAAWQAETEPPQRRDRGKNGRVHPAVESGAIPKKPTVDRVGPISKVDAARAAAQRSGAIVLLKGPDTVIATPSGSASVHAAAYEREAPWLATAGAGDVLAGLITGLAARSASLLHACEDAAWLHVEAARAFGPGLIAEDLPEMLPTVLRNLGV